MRIRFLSNISNLPLELQFIIWNVHQSVKTIIKKHFNFFSAQFIPIVDALFFDS